MPGLSEDYRVRAAEPADLPFLGGIEVAAGELFRTVGMDDVAGDEGFPIEELAAACARGTLWVADHEGEPVGYVLALQLDDQAHLEQLSVDPGHGRRGVGAALVEQVVRWAEARGAPDLTLATFRDVPWNAPYYARLGFSALDERDLTPVLLAVRAHEAAEGLDVGARVIMRRALGSTPAPVAGEGG